MFHPSDHHHSLPLDPLHPENKGTTTSFPCWSSFFCCSLGCSLSSRLQEHTTGSCPAFHPSGPPSAALLPVDTLTCLELPLPECNTLHFIELHYIFVGPLLKSVQVPLNDIPFFYCVNYTTHLDVVSKLAEVTLDVSVYAVDKDVE